MPTDEAILADWFWRRAGGPGPFPRDIAAAAAWVLPVFVAELPGLTVAAVGDWLRRRGVCVPDLPARPLRACLVARGGEGVILLDADDPIDERRYSAAHEIGHFLRDHVAVRNQVRDALGTSALDALDGLRPASVGERLDALLADVRLRPVTHLLDRDAEGDCASFETAEAEAAADRLGLELLAPRQDAERLLDAAPLPTADAVDRLAAMFGLPPRIAKAYARRLIGDRSAKRPLREWLGFPARAEKFENRCRTSDVPPEGKTPDD